MGKGWRERNFYNNIFFIVSKYNNNIKNQMPIVKEFCFIMSVITIFSCFFCFSFVFGMLTKMYPKRVDIII